MSKAEDRARQKALEAYPKDIEEYVDVNGVKSIVDNNSWQRTIFLKGYHQAEKDLELTWEEIYSILYFEREVLREFGNEEHSNEEVCKEVLKRFNKERKETKD